MEKIADSHGYVSNLLQTLALAPRGMAAYLDLGLYTRYESNLTAKQRLLAILAGLKDVHYGWAHHAPLALAAGLTEEQLLLIKEGRIPRDLPPPDHALIDYALEMAAGRRVSLRVAEGVHANFTPRQIVDIALLTAHSVATAALVIGLEVHIEPEETLAFERQWELGRDAGDEPG
jgi:alkylhydroperoxidase family enzyme